MIASVVGSAVAVIAIVVTLVGGVREDMRGVHEVVRAAHAAGRGTMVSSGFRKSGRAPPRSRCAASTGSR